MASSEAEEKFCLAKDIVLRGCVGVWVRVCVWEDGKECEQKGKDVCAV